MSFVALSMHENHGVRINVTHTQLGSSESSSYICAKSFGFRFAHICMYLKSFGRIFTTKRYNKGM